MFTVGLAMELWLPRAESTLNGVMLFSVYFVLSNSGGNAPNVSQIFFELAGGYSSLVNLLD